MLLLLVAGALLSLPAPAGDLAAARAAFCAGDWSEAATAASAIGGAEGHLLASLAWRVEGRYGRPDRAGRAEAYDESVRAAEAGLGAAPGDGRLRAALSSALARRCSLDPVRCVLEGRELVRAREELEAAVAASPEDPRLSAALGAWHARAGIAGVFAGADPELGRQLLAAAEAEVGDEVPLLFEMARAWRDLGERDRAIALFRRAAAVESDCAWEQAVQKRARAHHAELVGG